MIDDVEDLKCLSGKILVLGVSGSIAAYKSADLASEFRKAGAEVFVVMTESATRFISPLTMGTLSRNPVSVSLWDEEKNWQPGHIELADQADLFVVAPATANQIANFTHGNCPDLLSSIYLATPAPILIAPAMNGKMFEHPATAGNREILSERGVCFVEPVVGELACGYEGVGKMAPVEEIFSRAVKLLS
ncbi:phosphopantothenoylcysteine decarboxylase [Opitutales bacterium]|jgi:phosphopantothenoylcysteine decarboxylase|nr:phosphopantothenoylcysteine decarboxylase [Opitutales bacterium]